MEGGGGGGGVRGGGGGEERGGRPLEVTMTLTTKWPVEKNTTLNQHNATPHVRLVRATPSRASALRKDVPQIGTQAKHVILSLV